MKSLLYPRLQATIEQLVSEFDDIPLERKELLGELSSFIEHKMKERQKIELVFICTHNSRRSHIAQIWAQAAANYYAIEALASYSGGTESTAFNPRAVKALSKVGFVITPESESQNPVYHVSFSPGVHEILAFSKRYDDSVNPQKDFAAVMTCSHADENCPVVHGMEKRISLPFDDPKDFDGTELEDGKYMERVLEIGREILYAFSVVSN
jgi:arsenate reductase (thioredoxin)